MKQLEIADAAVQDIAEILSYYGSPTVISDRISIQLEEAVLHLCRWPNSGHRRTDLTPHDVFFWFAKPHFIVFQLQGDRLIVVAVLHNARNIPSVLRKRLHGT